MIMTICMLLFSSINWNFTHNQIVYVFNKGGSPIRLIFKDIFLQLCVISWIVIFSLIIYNIPT